MDEISVKLYEVEGGDVRRFPFKVPKEGNGSYQGVYSTLFEKVKQFCSNGTDFQLFWKDNEGDLIVLSTDVEVKEALRYREGEIFRIFVRSSRGLESPKIETVVTEKVPINVFIGDDLIAMEETPREEKGQDQQQQPDTGKIHIGIVCDGCEGGIEGVRFKCLVCRDYDLCAACEGKRIHDQHSLIRITQPGDRSWMPAFMASQGLNHIPFPGGKHGRCSFFGGRHGHGGPGHCHRAAGGGSEQQPQQQEQQQGREIPGSNFLRDVGQAVAAVLSGFGIDVDVDVDHEGQRTNVATAKSEKKDEKQEKKNEETGPNTTGDQPMEQVVSPPLVVTLESGPNTPEGQQDWMILENPDTAATTQEAAATATVSYPVLAPTPVTLVTDPRIAHALEYMMSMGFTNEGGWLTQLLEAKQGDIASVLEILHPSNKP